MSIPYAHPFPCNPKKNASSISRFCGCGGMREIDRSSRNAASHPFAGVGRLRPRGAPADPRSLYPLRPRKIRGTDHGQERAGRPGVPGCPPPLPALREFHRRRRGELREERDPRLPLLRELGQEGEGAPGATPGDLAASASTAGDAPARVRVRDRISATASAGEGRRGLSGTGRRSWASGPRPCGRRGSGVRRSAAPRAFSAGRWRLLRHPVGGAEDRYARRSENALRESSSRSARISSIRRNCVSGAMKRKLGCAPEASSRQSGHDPHAPSVPGFRQRRAAANARRLLLPDPFLSEKRSPWGPPRADVPAQEADGPFLAKNRGEALYHPNRCATAWRTLRNTSSSGHRR